MPCGGRAELPLGVARTLPARRETWPIGLRSQDLLHDIHSIRDRRTGAPDSAPSMEGRGKPMSEYVTRFSVRQRIEHVCGMVLFIALAVSGLAQKFFQAGWAQWTILAMGGIDRVRWVHRGAGIAFAALAIVHLGAGLMLVVSGRSRPSIVPTRKDFRDAAMMM